jgi:hypothetical protein
MIYDVIVQLLVLSALYGLALFGIFTGLGKLGISPEKRISLSFLLFGAVTGFLVAWAWPGDLAVIINYVTAFLGDEVYRLSLMYLGDASSPQAHYTIPWILRIPQVYVVVSIVVWSLIGSVIQFVYNWRAT